MKKIVLHMVIGERLVVISMIVKLNFIIDADNIDIQAPTFKWLLFAFLYSNAVSKILTLFTVHIQLKLNAKYRKIGNVEIVSMKDVKMDLIAWVDCHVLTVQIRALIRIQAYVSKPKFVRIFQTYGLNTALSMVSMDKEMLLKLYGGSLTQWTPIQKQPVKTFNQ